MFIETVPILASSKLPNYGSGLKNPRFKAKFVANEIIEAQENMSLLRVGSE
jgi:hypothetical protein